MSRENYVGIDLVQFNSFETYNTKNINFIIIQITKQKTKVAKQDMNDINMHETWA